MARGPRIDFPGAFHHVYARGIEKRDIFFDDPDREELRRRIAYNLERLGGASLAWVFMSNHFHLLFHSRRGNLPTFMRCLMSGYSIYFNRRHQRVGHLFQNRYKSTVVDSERYLFELIRYIHLNPLRSGVVTSVEELARYRWSGHYDILRAKESPWRNFRPVEEFFSAGDGESPILRYLKFLEEGTKTGPVGPYPAWNSGMGEAVGAADRYSGAIAEGEGKLDRTIRDVAEKLCMESGIPADKLRERRRSRTITRVRRRILEVCVMDLGMPRRMVSSWLGLSDAGGAFLLKDIASRRAGVAITELKSQGTSLN